MLLAELDLSALEMPQVDVTVTAVASGSGTVNGVVGYFEAQLSPGVVSSTSPALEPAPNSWGVPVWLLQEPAELRRGQELSLRYVYGGGTGGSMRLSV